MLFWLSLVNGVCVNKSWLLRFNSQCFPDIFSRGYFRLDDFFLRLLDYYFLSLLRLRHCHFFLFNLIFRRIDYILRLLFAVRQVILLLHHFFHSICINALAFHLV